MKEFKMKMSESQKIKSENRTTLSLSLSVSDKTALKKRSLDEGKTMASIVHEWIAEWKDEAEI